MKLAGSSDQDVASAEASPAWPTLAPTLRYDAACLGDGPPPTAGLAKATQPVLLTTGATLDPHAATLPLDFFGAAADAATKSLPNAHHLTIPLPGHIAAPEALGPSLSQFFKA